MCVCVPCVLLFPVCVCVPRVCVLSPGCVCVSPVCVCPPAVPTAVPAATAASGQDGGRWCWPWGAGRGVPRSEPMAGLDAKAASQSHIVCVSSGRCLRDSALPFDVCYCPAPPGLATASCSGITGPWDWDLERGRGGRPGAGWVPF